MHLHDLFAGIARFHIVVFASDQLATAPGAKDLEARLDRHTTQWRSNWTYGTTPLMDGYADKDLFKIHIIAGSGASATVSNTAVQAMSKREVGEGKVFVDKDGKVHRLYGFAPTRSTGGIVVLRPDSHIGYRVHGIQEDAWRDVDQYFSTILVSRFE